MKGARHTCDIISHIRNMQNSDLEMVLLAPGSMGEDMAAADGVMLHLEVMTILLCLYCVTC